MNKIITVIALFTSLFGSAQMDLIFDSGISGQTSFGNGWDTHAFYVFGTANNNGTFGSNSSYNNSDSSLSIVGFTDGEGYYKHYMYKNIEELGLYR